MLDNVKIHHGNEILELSDHFGIHIEYLPTYSPDHNPIEEAFSKIKHFMRLHQDYYGQRTGNCILYDMYEVLDIVTSDDAKASFAYSGYF